MVLPSDERHLLAIAFEWVSRIVAIGLEMVLPGVGGSWLDARFGTKFLALMGFAFGLVVGIWHLLVIAGRGKDQAKGKLESKPPGDGD